ncbi:hypothetical protein [Vibrio harveyi]
MNNNGLVLCSVMVKPVRQRVKDSFRTWLDIISVVPNHTFVVEERSIPLDKTNPSGYWYCAGEFCDIDEAGVHQHLEEANISYAQCLVSPNIKDDHPLRATLVIEGEYSVNYVCHNITNRVLYATDDHLTLGDIEIPKTGYGAVIKSALGVYGQNKVEWKRRKNNCSVDKEDQNASTKIDPSNLRTEECENEIDKLHIAACRGDKHKANKLTNALASVDEQFLITTNDAVISYNQNEIDFDTYTKLMVNACSTLFSETVKTVGLDLAKEIYPGCNLDVEYLDIEEEPQQYLMACG